MPPKINLCSNSAVSTQKAFPQEKVDQQHFSAWRHTPCHKGRAAIVVRFEEGKSPNPATRLRTSCEALCILEGRPGGNSVRRPPCQPFESIASSFSGFFLVYHCSVSCTWLESTRPINPGGYSLTHCKILTISTSTKFKADPSLISTQPCPRHPSRNDHQVLNDVPQ